jgi:hypothetical protein
VDGIGRGPAGSVHDRRFTCAGVSTLLKRARAGASITPLARQGLLGFGVLGPPARAQQRLLSKLNATGHRKHR